jgi:glyoxylase I family protein
MGWVHHIDITVSDLAVSTAFYDQVLNLMGFRRIRDGGEVPLWAGDRMEVGLQQGRPGHTRLHDRYSPGLHHLALWRVFYGAQGGEVLS